MSEKGQPDYAELLDRFIDGEVTTGERQLLLCGAAEDPALGSKLASAMELQRALAGLPAEKAPTGLQRRLRTIPDKHPEPGPPRGWLLRPHWLIATAALVLALVGGGALYQHQQQEAELAQAKADLELVLAYLEKVNLKTRNRIHSTVSEVTSEPVARITARTLQDQLQLRQEFEL